MEPSDSLTLRQIGDDFKAGVASAFGKQQWHDALVDKTDEEFLESRPIEGQELVLRHEAVRSLVQGNERHGSALPYIKQIHGTPFEVMLQERRNPDN